MFTIPPAIQKTLMYLFFIPLLFFTIILIVNREQVRPTTQELFLLNKKFGDINIRRESDVFRISKKVFSEISHQENINFPLSIISTIENSKGLCYDRSLILQKIFVFNDIPVRPIYIYYSGDEKRLSVFNLFDKNLLSHSVFEFYFNEKWCVMKTNENLSKMMTLNEYMVENESIWKNAKYIRYLSNRNGKFIYPSIMPDIYFF